MTNAEKTTTRDDLGWFRVVDGKLPDDSITVRVYGKPYRLHETPEQFESRESKQGDACLEDGVWYGAEDLRRWFVSHWQELPADPVDAGSFLEQPATQADGVR